MKITSNLYIKGYTPTNTNQNTKNKSEISTDNALEKLPYCPLAFKAVHNIKSKKVDVESAKSKLLKQMNEILESNMDLEELKALYERQVNKEQRYILNRLKKMAEEIDSAENMPLTSPLYYYEKLLSMEKEVAVLEKKLEAIKPFTPPKDINERTMDVVLVNKLKSALLEDNFNFEKIYKNHYKTLEKIEKIDELNRQFPRIKTPQHPLLAVAEKIEACLTRNFYEDLDDIAETEDMSKAFDFCFDKTKELYFKTPNANDEIFKEIVYPTCELIISKYVKIKQKNAFSALPEYRKNQIPQITEIDKKLLSVDYDKFVLHVLKEQYLQNKKPNQISYSENGTNIQVSQLQSTPYKFDKTSEKMKGLLSSATEIKTAIRNYDSFDDEKLRSRLSYFSTKDLGDNEEILTKIIDFDSCDLSTKDKEQFIKFLRILDQISDEDITISDALKTIKQKDIKPKEAEKKEKIEKLKIAEEIKKEQKKAFELDKLKANFDNAINLLYINGINSIATLASEYRPQNLEPNSIQKANFIVDIINQNIDEDGSIKNKQKIKSNISAFDTYIYYSTTEPNSKILEEAKKFAKTDNGTDIIKAGYFLNNAEIIKNLPTSIRHLENKELIEKIIEKADTESEQIQYLCKYNEYENLQDEEKTHIKTLTSLFDAKNNVEKYILKYIIENDYIQKDTIVFVNLKDDLNKIKTTLTANAKQQIIAKYKFPTCLPYLEGFEESLKTFAAEQGTSGIKKTSTNKKACEYKLEIKLSGHDDRIFSVENDFYFDVFSDKGLH